MAAVEGIATVSWGMRWASLVPELVVTDLTESLGFYTGLLGFEVLFERPRFAYMRLVEAQLMLLEGSGDPAPGGRDR
jgi:catechol 2,3-dioxygenase-like lactoylglutathione lyase family enzyme